MDYSSIESVAEMLLGAGAGVLVIGGLLGLALCVFLLVCSWKVFGKMGMPGWYCLIPYFGSYMETRAVYGIGWWFLITVIPTVAGWIGISGFLLTLLNLVVLVYNIKYNIDLSLCFGKQWWFCFILVFLPFIGIPMLAFGQATYRGPRVAGPLNLSLV